MMYWYKPWLELRSRMLVAALAIGAGCLIVVWKQEALRHFRGESITYSHYLWKLVYNSLIRNLFVLMTILLGCGSLKQERAQGTAGFSLSLPVSRWTATLDRALVGYAGVVVLALIPSAILSPASALVGQHYAVQDALRFSLLYCCVGSVVYAYTCLLSHWLEGEYTAVLLGIPVLIAYEALFSLPGLNRFRSLDLLAMMTGEDMPWFDERTAQFTGALPWMGLALLLAMAAGCVLLAARQVAGADFN